GLQASDRIVVNGIQRVRPGDAVRAHLVPMDADQDPNSAPLAQTRAKADKNS
ncbi:efflux transporter periplasmic adaptor subunit, partial [Paraburkholderia sp. SIMBA_027]